MGEQHPTRAGRRHPHPRRTMATMTTTLAPTTTTRPPARWAVPAAHLVPLRALPSRLSRIALVRGLTGFPTGEFEGSPHWVYPVFLSVLSEALALLTLGLVQPWGETLPRWVPLLGGRRIPVLAAVIPAVLGALAVTAIWSYAAWGAIF